MKKLMTHRLLTIKENIQQFFLSIFPTLIFFFELYRGESAALGHFSVFICLSK